MDTIKQDDSLLTSIQLIEKRIFALRNENAERLKRTERVNNKIEKLLAIKSSLHTLVDNVDSDMLNFHYVIERLVKSNYSWFMQYCRQLFFFLLR